MAEEKAMYTLRMRMGARRGMVRYRRLGRSPAALSLSDGRRGILPRGRGTSPGSRSDHPGSGPADPRPPSVPFDGMRGGRP
jgi:hypothetical protein